MGKKGRSGTRLIRVKPADDDGNNPPPMIVKYDNVVEKEQREDQNKTTEPEVESPKISEHDQQIAEIDDSFLEVELAFIESLKDDPQASKNEDSQDVKRTQTKDQEDEVIRPIINSEITKKKKKKIKKNAVAPLDVGTSEETKEHAINELNEEEQDSGNSKIKKTKKKSKKNKKKKETKEPVKESQQTTKEPVIEIVADVSEENKPADDKKKKRKLPACFGFISTWLAKRKQKRREKKKKAIADRASLPELVHYGHTKAKGGEAFVIEVDSRPMVKKPVLPPIQQTSGPIRRADDRQQIADARREEELAKKREVARKHEAKMLECRERKEDADFHFRKKARLTIRYKQADAERKRDIISRNRITTRPTSVLSSISRRRITTRPTSVLSSSSESVIIEKDPGAGKVDDDDIFSF